MAMRSLPPAPESRTSSRASEAAFAQPRLGRIVAAADGDVSVEFEGGRGPTRARVAVGIDARQMERALAEHHSAILVFENGDPGLPILVGLLAPAAPREADAEPSDPGPTRVVEADVDGKRVRITGHDEIVFECGKASITLRRNGRVVIRGAYVETYASGTNRIKGGQVLIN